MYYNYYNYIIIYNDFDNYIGECTRTWGALKR